MEIIYGDKPTLLNRRPQLICPREGKPPIKFGFGPDGLDPNADVVVLEGENRQLAINDKVDSVLKAPGWWNE